jgi:hypothetical protein
MLSMVTKLAQSYPKFANEFDQKLPRILHIEPTCNQKDPDFAQILQIYMIGVSNWPGKLPRYLHRGP